MKWPIQSGVNILPAAYAPLFSTHIEQQQGKKESIYIT